MKFTITSLLLAVALWSGAAYAEKPAPALTPVKTQVPAPVPREADVQKDIDSVVSNCEKKKLPMEKEIECIEQGFLEFMGEK